METILLVKIQETTINTTIIQVPVQVRVHVDSVGYTRTRYCTMVASVGNVYTAGWREVAKNDRKKYIFLKYLLT